MDITEALCGLSRSGLSQKAIAAAVGTSQSTINRALAGADVRYSIGQKILNLYADLASVESNHPTDGSTQITGKHAVQASSNQAGAA